MKQSFWIFLVIVLFLVACAGGVIYWSVSDTKKSAEAALNAAKNSQARATPTPSPSNSVTPSVSLTMPAEDVPGEDLADVPRVGNAIRTSYDKADDGSVINLEYVVNSASQAILDFYRANLSSTGWNLSGQNSQSLSFSKEVNDLAIEIIEENKSANITQYRLHFFKTQ